MGLRRVRARVAGLLAAAVSLPACATFADLPAVPEREPAALRVRVSVSGESYLETGRGAWRPWGDAGAHRALEALQGAGWFAEVSPDVSPYDYEVKLAVRTYQASTRGGLLSLLTGFVVPSVRAHRVQIEAAIVSASGEVSGCEAHQDYTVWMQLLLLPLYPFTAPAHHEMQLVRRLALRCVDDALPASGELARTAAAPDGPPRRVAEW